MYYYQLSVKGVCMSSADAVQVCKQYLYIFSYLCYF